MVNVGGRSKGCSTCRRRRVKCDENRPTCLRCQRSSLQCDGPKDLTFIDATAVASRGKTWRSQNALTAGTTESHDEAVSGSSQSMSLSAPLVNLEEAYIMFTRSHLADDGPIDRALRELQSKDINRLESNRVVDCRTSHLRTALSFAMIFFGTQHKQSNITQQGYLSHGVTLQQLNRALSEPDCYKYDEIIVSVTTLAIQETLVPSGPKFFLNHMLGLEKLLALRDPRLYRSQRTIGLYKCLRHMLLFASLGTGRGSILARPEWKEMFRQACETEQEAQEQQLYDVLADCSVLACARDELCKRWETDEEGPHEDQVDHIRQRTLALFDHLQAWRTSWDAVPENVPIEVPTAMPPYHLPKESGSHVGLHPPPDFVFLKISSALMLMLYNVATINLLMILTSLPSSSQQEASQGDYVAAIHGAVLEIYRSMPYASTAELQRELHTSPAVHWASQIAQVVLQGDESVEAKWLVGILRWKSTGVALESLEMTG